MPAIRLPGEPSSRLAAVVADRIGRASRHDAVHELDLFGFRRLALHEGKSGIFVAGEKLRRLDAALVAINAAHIDIVAAWHIFRETFS